MVVQLCEKGNMRLNVLRNTLLSRKQKLNKSFKFNEFLLQYSSKKCENAKRACASSQTNTS